MFRTYSLASPPIVRRTLLLKYRRKFCIGNPELFLNHNTFILSLSLTLYSSQILPPPDWHVDTSAHRTIGSIFPSAERLGVEIGSCWRAVFFSILRKKSRLGVAFGNSWRCLPISLVQFWILLCLFVC